MKIISTKFHGYLDYIVGIALILAPMLFSFSDVGGAAVFIPRLLGVGLIVYSLLTKYELGVIKIIPMKVHLVIDVIAALFLAMSPWLFGFQDQPLHVWLPHFIVGLTVVVVVALSQSTPKMAMSMDKM